MCHFSRLSKLEPSVPPSNSSSYLGRYWGLQLINMTVYHRDRETISLHLFRKTPGCIGCNRPHGYGATRSIPCHAPSMCRIGQEYCSYSAISIRAVFTWFVLLKGLQQSPLSSAYGERTFINHKLETFIPFDMESALSAAMVLTMWSAIDINANLETITLIRSVENILEEMVSKGNLVAQTRLVELRQLQQMLSDIRQPTQVMQDKGEQPGVDANEDMDLGLMSPGSSMPESSKAMETNILDEGNVSSVQDLDDLLEWPGFDPLASPQLLAVADLLDTFNAEGWYSFETLTT